MFGWAKEVQFCTILILEMDVLLEHAVSSKVMHLIIVFWLEILQRLLKKNVHGTEGLKLIFQKDRIIEVENSIQR